MQANEKFIEWMTAATLEERREMAKLAGTSMSMLYQMQYPKEKGGRQAASELAGRIETAAGVVTAKAPQRLPVLTRGDLSPACASCDYFRTCGEKE